MLKHNLHQAQDRMTKYVVLKMIEREFVLGDWVYLWFQPYKQVLVAHQRDLKLAPRYYGPFPVLQRVGAVAYHLDLPPLANINATFHVS